MDRVGSGEEVTISTAGRCCRSRFLDRSIRESSRWDVYLTEGLLGEMVQSLFASGCFIRSMSSPAIGDCCKHHVRVVL